MGHCYTLDFTERGYIGTLEDVDASLMAIGFERGPRIMDPTVSTGMGSWPYSAVYSIENGADHGIFDGRVPTAHLFAIPKYGDGVEKGAIIFFNCNESILERVQGNLGLSAKKTS